MRVKAKDLNKQWSGFYAPKRRAPGDEFDIKGPEEFSFRWMECVDPNYLVEDGEIIEINTPKKRGPKPKELEVGE